MSGWHVLAPAHSRSLSLASLAALATGLLAGVPAVAASAGTTTTTAAAATTTAPAPTTATTPTASPGTTVAVATETTSVATTSAATTATAPVTAVAPSATAAAEATATTSRSFARGCPVSAVALVLPHRLPLLLGPVATSVDEVGGLSSLVYAAAGAVVSGRNVTVSETGCTAEGPVEARAAIGPVSLFDGAVAAERVALAVGRRQGVSVEGLRVAGRRVLAAAGSRVQLGSWGYLTVGTGRTRLGAGGGAVAGALAIHLSESRAGLPAGTVVLVSAAGSPRAASVAAARPQRRRRRLGHRPLKVTPPLGAQRYVFPVVGADASFGDTYGAFRGDVAGRWHHGDDIFAPLGTPVVAVASGTIGPVGWDSVGGWRLWVTDAAGDQFYYAHLSGYVPGDLRSSRVAAGQVIGFVGNTGDAFTTQPHLHFEVHPRSLLRLGYDGAVDPTGYLRRWPHLEHVRAPRPVDPPLPAQPAVRAEARYVWRELLAARHLIRRAPAVPPRLARPSGADAPPSSTAPSRQATAAEPAPAHSAPPSLAAVLAVNAVGGLALLTALALPLALSSSPRARPRRARDPRPEQHGYTALPEPES